MEGGNAECLMFPPHPLNRWSDRGTSPLGIYGIVRNIIAIDDYIVFFFFFFVFYYQHHELWGWRGGKWGVGGGGGGGGVGGCISIIPGPARVISDFIRQQEMEPR